MNFFTTVDLNDIVFTVCSPSNPSRPVPCTLDIVGRFCFPKHLINATFVLICFLIMSKILCDCFMCMFVYFMIRFSSIILVLVHSGSNMYFYVGNIIFLFLVVSSPETDVIVFYCFLSCLCIVFYFITVIIFSLKSSSFHNLLLKQ